MTETQAPLVARFLDIFEDAFVSDNYLGDRKKGVARFVRRGPGSF